MVDRFLQAREPIAAFLVAVVKLRADRVELVAKRRDFLPMPLDLGGPDVELLRSALEVGLAVGDGELAVEEVDADRLLGTRFAKSGPLRLPGLTFRLVPGDEVGDASIRLGANGADRVLVLGHLGPKLGEQMIGLVPGGAEGDEKLLGPRQFVAKPGALGLQLGRRFVELDGRRQGSGQDRGRRNRRGDRRGRRFGRNVNRVEANVDVERPEREAVAVLEVGPAHADAVEQEDLRGGEPA